jgi:predicted amidophosphoribosyltransferase
VFCPSCGQSASATDSSCANCGKPLRFSSRANPALIAATLILAVTTLAGGGAAIYYQREATSWRP